MSLKISHVEENTELLGPFKRFVIWVWGCCFDCEGCVAQNTRHGAYAEIEAEDLAKKILQSDCEGVTISGGEPFLQAQELFRLIEIIKQEKNIGVIIYSGFTLNEIKNNPDFLNLLSVADILIDGRYEKNLDEGRAYIGSSNQVIHYLTDRYKVIGPKFYDKNKKRKAEIKFTSSQAVLIGVPSKEVFKVWQSVKEKTGGTQNAF